MVTNVSDSKEILQLSGSCQLIRYVMFLCCWQHFQAHRPDLNPGKEELLPFSACKLTMKITVELLFFIRLYMLYVFSNTLIFMHVIKQVGDVETFLICPMIQPFGFFTPPWGLSKFDQFPSLAWSKCLITFTTVSVQPLNIGILKSVMLHEIGHWQGIFIPCFQPRDSGHSLALPPLPQPVLTACLAASLQPPLGSSSNKGWRFQEKRHIYQVILFELVWLAIGIFLLQLKVFNNSYILHKVLWLVPLPPMSEIRQTWWLAVFNRICIWALRSAASKRWS